jgi:hypothetical protein
MIHFLKPHDGGPKISQFYSNSRLNPRVAHQLALCEHPEQPIMPKWILTVLSQHIVYSYSQIDQKAEESGECLGARTWHKLPKSIHTNQPSHE